MQFFVIWWLVEVIADAWNSVKNSRAEAKFERKVTSNAVRPAPAKIVVKEPVFVQGYGKVKD